MTIKATIMNSEDMERTITRLAHQMIEKNRGTENMVIVGIQTRGAHLAKRLAKKINDIEGKEVPTGYLDATLYRDDFLKRIKQPSVQVTDIPFAIDEKNVFLIDDVLYTGRTVRAALDALMAFGRPDRIYLAVLVDRGHRELPIKADLVGKNVPTSIGETVAVRVNEVDQEDAVYLVHNE
ncbi:MAG: bifunctional pyr operon transcriptional regulator/uracil phosphoribosyltransferase PyrR [Calditrichia bacterium]